MREVKDVRSDAVEVECDKQLVKLKRYIGLINRMHSPVPDNFIELKTRMLIAQDEVSDIKRGLVNIGDLKEVDENLSARA